VKKEEPSLFNKGKGYEELLNLLNNGRVEW